MKTRCIVLVCMLCLLFFEPGCLSQQAPPSQPDAVALSESPIHDLNDELPSWLQFSGQVRFRVEGYTGGGFKDDSEDAYLLTRVFLNMRAQPTSWLTFFFQGMDAHAPWKNTLPAGAPFRDTMDLRQGYVEIGGMETADYGLRVGRQELAFGEERLVGPSPWLNTARSFDGAHGTYHENGIRLDAFAASVVKINQGQFDEIIPGNNFYGLYSSFTRLVPKATLEPYFFWRRQSGLKTETADPGILNFGTFGARWVGTLPRSFEYGTEMAIQNGSLGTESISAWAGHWLLGYKIAKARFSPRLFTEFNFASGDKNPTDNHGGTFNQLYPTGHDKYGLTDQVGWQNIKHTRTGVDLKLARKWSFTGKDSAYWLADARDALYSASGAVLARSKAGTAGTYVGQELEFVSAYKIDTRASVSGGFGHLFSGTFLKNTTQGVGYSYPFVMTSYDF
jgi:hypothetical protein